MLSCPLRSSIDAACGVSTPSRIRFSIASTAAFLAPAPILRAEEPEWMQNPSSLAFVEQNFEARKALEKSLERALLRQIVCTTKRNLADTTPQRRSRTRSKEAAELGRPYVVSMSMLPPSVGIELVGTGCTGLGRGGGELSTSGDGMWGDVNEFAMRQRVPFPRTVLTRPYSPHRPPVQVGRHKAGTNRNKNSSD